MSIFKLETSVALYCVRTSNGSPRNTQPMLCSCVAYAMLRYRICYAKVEHLDAIREHLDAAIEHLDARSEHKNAQGEHFRWCLAMRF